MNKLEYRAANAISQSDLKLILKSDKHYVNRDRIHAKETEAMKFGTIVHFAIENPVKFRETYKVLPEFWGATKDGKQSKQSKEAKDKKAAYLLANPDQLFIEQDEMDDLTGMLNSIAAHPFALSLFQNAQKEVVKFDNWDGYDVKGCCDIWLPEHPLLGKNIKVEFKTSIDASPEAFARDVLKRGYDFQDAWYEKLFKAERSLTVVAEKTFPWPIAVYDMSEWIPEGNRKIKIAFQKLKELEERDGEALGYTKTFDILQVPSWIAARGE